MEKLSRIVCALLLGCALQACEPAQGTRIAYVDVQKVVRDSKAGKDLTKQIKAYSDKAAKKVRPEQTRLEREQQRIAQQRNTLSAAALADKERGFREKVVRFQQRVKNENERLQAGAQESLVEIEEVLEQIYKEVVGKNKIDLLVNAGMVLDADERVDLTDQVIEILDERLPKVNLTVPKE